MKSAVFVDFDNVYSQLRQLQPEVAERFARQPTHWINWLVDALPLPKPSEDGDRRRLLVRRCYLNPNWYQAYRHAFLRAGFEIVDCPPVTSQGKTSTDIHMVLDIIDLLQAETRCDEFIVLSPTSRRSCASCAGTTGVPPCLRSVFRQPRTRRRLTC